MKYKFSRKLSLIIGTFAILLYIIGIIFSNIDEQRYYIIGITCEVIALLYTSASTLFSAVIPPVDKIYVTPSFVDRGEAIQFCISELYDTIYEKKNGGIIAIKYAPTGSIGKTELLKKLVQVLKNNSAAKEYLPLEHYRKYRKIRKKIGDIYFETYREESDFSRVNAYPRTLSHYDIVIWDNLPQTDFIPVSRKKLIMILCRKANISVGENAVLTCMSKSDMVNLCKSKGQQSIDDDLLERLMRYSQGNMKIISEVLGSEDNIDNFKMFSNSLYSVKAAIEHGEYDKAKTILDSIKRDTNQIITGTNKIQLDILEADLLHFKNRYKEANEAFITIAAKVVDNETRTEIYERQCHMQRHLGDFKAALSICEYLPERICLPRSLGLNFMAYSHYENELYREQAMRILDTMHKDLKSYTSDRRDSYHTYLAVEKVYENDFMAAHQAIDVAIKLYESLRSKYLTNCYFIKAEIYRHSGYHSNACKYYQKCLGIYEFNGDFDIYTLVYTMIIYENIVHNAKHVSTWNIPEDMMYKRVEELGMAYNNKLVMNLQKYRSSSTSQEEKTEISRFFEKYVFIIP